MATKTELSAIAVEICKLEGFHFIASVGNGEFKQTFHVRNSAGTSFALKVFFEGTSTERQAREISAMQRCNHPSIAKFHFVKTSAIGNSTYLWMLEEFLDAGTMTSVLKKGALDSKTAKSMGKHLIDAIHHVAALNLVHRDLKPDNIMFRSTGPEPVILDFGLVRDLSLISVTSTWAMQGPGTPYFSSPEQLNNEKEMIDWRADQFALGALFSLAVLGLHPYQHAGDSPQIAVERVAKRHSHSQEFLTSAQNNGFGIFVKMTAPWPIQRFRTPVLLSAAWNA